MHLRAALVALLLLPLPGHTAPAAPRVVVSIAPIHSLVAAVMGEAGEPRLLMPAGASPHNYALLPSDARALARADLIVWVGPALERFLVKPLDSLAGDAGRLELARRPGMTLLETREDAHSSDVHERDRDDGHAHGSHDMHLWLDPLNAIQIAVAVADRLAALDPPRAADYRRNAEALRQRLLELDARTRRALEPVRGFAFVVFHDAYHYFERRYELRAVGILTLSPEIQPGARRVAETRRDIVRLHARCVFREPQFEPGLVRTLVEGTSARIGVLDPLGAELEPGPEAYFQLIDRLTASLRDCLSQP